jgi:hypothetical protein
LRVKCTNGNNTRSSCTRFESRHHARGQRDITNTHHVHWPSSVRGTQSAAFEIN